MMAAGLIDGWVEALLALVLVTGAFIVSRRDLHSLVFAYTIQSLFLVFIALLLYLAHPSEVLLSIALLTLSSKVLLIPYTIKRIQKQIKISRDVEFHYISPTGSLFVTILLFLFVYYSFSGVIGGLFTADKISYTGAVFGVSLMLMGMLVTFSRKKVITKIIGYLTMENGVLLFGLFLTELPLIIEVLIIIDLIIMVLLVTILAAGMDSTMEEFHNRLHIFRRED
ncbi:MAG: hydrogenase subunit [Candidatus Altiarchaeales archaeon IMC4]|nr:MAG: hydrogenase subunit [Candidatus Altiarchaeales archaeon IMC4]